MSIFEVALESSIDINHELVLLSRQMDWSEVESEFAENHCADNCRPGVPLWTMVGMMLMAVAANNMRHWMNKNAFSSFVSWLKTLFGRLDKVLLGNETNEPTYANSRGLRVEGLWQA